MHPALRYYTYYRGGGALPEPLVLDSEAIAFSTTEASAQSLFNSLWGPKMIWHEGKTHLGYQMPKTEAGRLNIVTYDERYGMGRPISFSRRTGSAYDTHHRPIIFADNDSLYVAVEKAHNTGPISILKNRTQGDDYIWELSATEIGTAPTYPMAYKKNGVFTLLNQASDTRAAYSKNSSGDFEGTWSIEDIISGLAPAEDEQYISIVLNDQTVSDKVIFVITGRDDDVVPAAWSPKYLVMAEVTAGGITYYNWDESFSKTSVLTTEELNTNFKYVDYGSDNSYIPVATLDNDGNFYDISGDGAGGYNLIYQMVGESSATSKAITLPGTPTILDGADAGGDGQNGGCSLLHVISSSEIYAYFRIQSGLYAKIFLYKTVDLGDTWTDEGDVFSTIDDDFYSVTLPQNVNSIPNNRNFVIAGVSVSSALADDYCALYFKKAAFGTIQSETGDLFDVTPYSESEFNALMTRRYKVEAGKVTNTSTVCNTLVDQSASGQDATSVGSPVMDSADTPTYVTLDGVNDRFTVPITGLTDLTEGTVIIVARPKQSTVTAMFAASNAGVTNQFIYYGTDANNKSRFSDSALSVIEGKTTLANAFHIFIFVHQNKGGAGVLQFVDGELQLRTPTTRGFAEGRMFDAVNSITVTRMDIGALIRSGSSAFYNMDIKEFAVSATPFNQEMISKACKKLATDHGITLNSHFQ